MAKHIEIDDSDFQRKSNDLVRKIFPDKVSLAIHTVASEILRLSQYEVPHDAGELQNSGSISDEKDESIVGYNKVYAARLHEHPEYQFQKGRKGKYLEDPIKMNLSVFLNYFKDTLGELFR